MNIYVASFVINNGIAQKAFIVFCYTSTELATAIVRAENVGYSLTSVAKLSNVYGIRDFLKLLESKGNSDLLFGDSKK